LINCILGIRTSCQQQHQHHDQSTHIFYFYKPLN
jgi:hypothetical protein